MATIVRWDPLTQVERIQREMDRMFARADVSLRSATRTVGVSVPEADVEPTEEADGLQVRSAGNRLPTTSV